MRDRGLGAEAVDELRIERLQSPGMARRDLQQPDHPVAGDERRAEHGRLARRRALVAVAVVVEQLGEPRDRLAGPCAPGVAIAIEPVDLGRGQRRLEVGVERQRQPDVAASRLGPGDLFGDQPERILAALADEERRRVIVVGQRAEPVEDLVEKILRMDQLHDPPVDPVAHLEHPIAVHRLDRVRHDRGDPGQQTAVVVIEGRRRTCVGHRAPGGAAAPDRREHQIAADRRPGMPDELADVFEVPGVAARQRDHQLRVGFALFDDRDAATGCLEEGAAFAEGVRHRLARITGRAQVLTQRVEKLEKLELS